jgi:hypothetical protein
MELHERIEQILVALRPAFRRTATFEWFVLLLWGTLLTTQAPAVTSYVNALGLGERYYHQALHWFHSQAFAIDELCQRWATWLGQHPQSQRLQGQRVYVGDGIKVSKEGRKMPGVKGLHQESADVSKPEWIRGHYFSALGQLLGAERALFAVPLILKLHDGIHPVDEASAGTLVDKMADLCLAYMVKGSYVILDAYYASVKVLGPLRTAGCHVISRARITTVATAAFSRCPNPSGPGRPRRWGSDIALKALFEPKQHCEQAQVWLYGKCETVYYQCFQFYWDSPEDLVLFVLTQLPNGNRIILISTDTGLTGVQVIEAYGWRFKIEVTFRTLIQVLSGFAYRFWVQSMETAARWPQDLYLADYPQAFQVKVARKVEAFERFINLNAIAMGILQVLALELPHQVWQHFPGWFRTVPQHGYPSEQMVRRAIQAQDQQTKNLMRSNAGQLLAKFLADKLDPE